MPNPEKPKRKSANRTINKQSDANVNNEAATGARSAGNSQRGKQTRQPGPGRASLNDKQLRFVDEYLIDLNATQAAIRAGYSPKTAGAQAHKLLKIAEIQTAITAGREKTAQSLELTREACLRQYQRLGFSDPRKFFDAYGQLKPISELDDDTAAAVQGFEVEMRQLDGPDAPPVPVLKVKWADRRGALDSIMKAQGWNAAEKRELTGPDGKPIAVETSVRVVKVPLKQKAEVSFSAMTEEDE